MDIASRHAPAEPMTLLRLGNSDGDRFLMALAYYGQEAGHAADGIIIVAMARTPDELIERLLAQVRVYVEQKPGDLEIQVLINLSADAYIGVCEVPSYGGWVFKGDGSCQLKVLECSMEDVVSLDLSNMDKIAAAAAAPGLGSLRRLLDPRLLSQLSLSGAGCPD